MCLLFTEMALAAGVSQDEGKRLDNAEVPLSPTLPENVAVQWVIFITNEINNATICTQLSPGGLHQPYTKNSQVLQSVQGQKNELKGDKCSTILENQTQK